MYYDRKFSLINALRFLYEILHSYLPRLSTLTLHLYKILNLHRNDKFSSDTRTYPRFLSLYIQILWRCYYWVSVVVVVVVAYG